MSKPMDGIGGAAGTRIRRVGLYGPPWVRPCPLNNGVRQGAANVLGAGWKKNPWLVGGTKNLFLRIKEISYP